MGKWQRHKTKWKDCKECELCETRKNVVLLRGTIPADILFIGEAPGIGEDVLGKPFIGPAGKLLDRMISDSIQSSFKLAFTNLIACVPLDIDGNKVHDPDKEHIKACSDRLEEVINIVDPDYIVLVGNLASKWVPLLFDISVPMTTIIHPAAILRADISQKGLAIQSTMVALRDAADSLIPF